MLVPEGIHRYYDLRKYSFAIAIIALQMRPSRTKLTIKELRQTSVIDRRCNQLMYMV